MTEYLIKNSGLLYFITIIKHRSHIQLIIIAYKNNQCDLVKVYFIMIAMWGKNTERERDKETFNEHSTNNKTIDLSYYENP